MFQHPLVVTLCLRPPQYHWRLIHEQTADGAIAPCISTTAWYQHIILPLGIAFDTVVSMLQEASREDDGFFIKDGIIVVTKGM
jgi:hypothetical protein